MSTAKKTNKFQGKLINDKNSGLLWECFNVQRKGKKEGVEKYLQSAVSGASLIEKSLS